MKAYALAAVLCVAAVANGYAADLPVTVAPAARSYSVPASYNWSGFYLGVNGGYGFGTSSWDSSFAGTGNFNVNGALAGGTVGINYQAGSFVFGFEADGDWTGFTGASNNALCALSAQTAGAVCQTKETWLVTVRGRAGYAVNRLLIFATAGGATGNVEAGLRPPGTVDDLNNFGWTAGGGIEAAITDYWTVKLEYLYVDLGNATCNLNCGLTVTVPLTESLVRAGINFKLPF
jgi:outer membrane immunogenic protein